MFLDALERAQAAVKKDLKEAKLASTLASQATALRVESLEIALKRANSAKNKWQARAVEAEEVAGQMQAGCPGIEPAGGGSSALRCTAKSGCSVLH